MKFNEKYKCSQCGKILMSDVDLQIHQREFHPETTKQQMPNLKTQVQTQVQTQAEIHTIETLNLNRHNFISGQTQSGKSVVGKFIFVNIKPTQKAIFFDYKLDPNHDNFVKHFETFDSLSGIKKHFENPKTLLGKSKDMRVVYRPPRIINKDVTKTHSLDNPRWAQINDLAEFCYNKGNVILFIDEISPFTSPQNIPPSLYDCLIMGASRGVVLVITTQRPSTIHNTIISEAYTRFLFRHTLESDRIKLRGIVGPIAEQLQGLPERKFYISYINGDVQPGELIIPKKYKWIL